MLSTLNCVSEKKIKQEPVAVHMGEQGGFAESTVFGAAKVAFVPCTVFFYKAQGTGSRIWVINYPKTDSKELRPAQVWNTGLLKLLKHGYQMNISTKPAQLQSLANSNKGEHISLRSTD